MPVKFNKAGIKLFVRHIAYESQDEGTCGQQAAIICETVHTHDK